MKAENILDRDRTGKCVEGECRDRVLELQSENQSNIAHEKHSTSETPNAPGAKSRNIYPGFLGGHV